VDLPQGQGVVEATKEQTVIALGGKPVGGEPPAESGPSDKSDVGGKPHAPGHRSPGDKLTGAPGGPVDDGPANAEPKAAAPDSHKSAAAAPTETPEPRAASKPAVAASTTAPSKPAAQATASAPSKPAAQVTAPAPSKPAAQVTAPAPSKSTAETAAVAPSKSTAQADAPSPSKPIVLAAATAPSKPAAQAAPAPSKPAAPALAPFPETPKAVANPPATTTAATPAPGGPGGRLDRAKTEALVKSHMSEVKRCYKWGSEPQTNGRVTLRIAVSLTGAVTSAKVESSTLRSSAAESCIVEAVRSWKFPAPVGGPAVALYPFDFH